MGAVIATNWIPLLIALLIGLATAWWIWGAHVADDDEEPQEEAEYTAYTAVPPQPALNSPALTNDAPDGYVTTAAVPAETVDGYHAIAPELSTPDMSDAEPAGDEPAAIAESGIDTAPAALVTPHAGPRITPAQGAPDDLTLLKGVGPKLNDILNGLGVTRFDQIAQWTAADIAEVDPYLEPFSGRIEREEWVEQARLLAAGDLAAYEARFGKPG